MTTFVYAPTTPTTNLQDNAHVDNQTYYLYCSPFCRWRFTTTATHMWLKIYANLYTTYPAWTKVDVLVNGVTTTLTCPTNGFNMFTVELGTGTKTVEIVPGLQAKPGGGLLGMFPRTVAFFGGTVVSQTAVTNPAARLMVYGDSIGVGANATAPITQGWAMIVRQSLDVFVEAWGSRTLYSDGVDSTARQAFVDRIAALAPSVVWLAIGTNDYGLNPWAVADFEVAYADLLDKLHTALPAAPIYAQTPIYRRNETTPNGSGDTLPDYRTAIASAVSTRTAFCTLISGLDILGTDETYLADGLHPTTAGHAVYAAFVLAALGL